MHPRISIPIVLQLALSLSVSEDAESELLSEIFSLDPESMNAIYVASPVTDATAMSRNMEIRRPALASRDSSHVNGQTTPEKNSFILP